MKPIAIVSHPQLAFYVVVVFLSRGCCKKMLKKVARKSFEGLLCDCHSNYLRTAVVATDGSFLLLYFASMCLSFRFKLLFSLAFLLVYIQQNQIFRHLWLPLFILFDYFGIMQKNDDNRKDIWNWLRYKIQ